MVLLRTSQKLAACLLDTLIRLSPRARRPLSPRELCRRDWRTDTAGMGLRFTERLRDRWRRRWLRIRVARDEPQEKDDG